MIIIRGRIRVNGALTGAHKVGQFKNNEVPFNIRDKKEILSYICHNYPDQTPQGFKVFYDVYSWGGNPSFVTYFKDSQDLELRREELRLSEKKHLQNQ